MHASIFILPSRDSLILRYANAVMLRTVIAQSPPLKVLVKTDTALVQNSMSIHPALDT